MLKVMVHPEHFHSAPHSRKSSFSTIETSELPFSPVSALGNTEGGERFTLLLPLGRRLGMRTRHGGLEAKALVSGTCQAGSGIWGINGSRPSLAPRLRPCSLSASSSYE